MSDLSGDSPREGALRSIEGRCHQGVSPEQGLGHSVAGLTSTEISSPSTPSGLTWTLQKNYSGPMPTLEQEQHGVLTVMAVPALLADASDDADRG